MGAKKTTILAVDDEPRLLKFLALNLQAQGFAALTTCPGYIGYPFKNQDGNSHRGSFVVTCQVCG